MPCGEKTSAIDARATGRGRHVDVSMTDSVLAHTYFVMLRLAEHGTAAPRGGDLLSGGVPCYAVYRCADDGHMAVGALEGKFWKLCCATLDRPDWVARQWDPGLRAEMAALFATRPRDAWADAFAAVDCCVTPVLTPVEALVDAQASARGMSFVADGVRQFAPPLRMSEMVFSVARNAPKTGEHSAEILASAGCSEAEIAGWKAGGAIR